MADRGNHSTGSVPLDDGPAAGDHRTVRRLAGDFARRPLAMIGLVILVVAALDTLFAPMLVGDRAETYHVAEELQGWSRAHPLGTNDLGQDELARLLVGIHSSALFAGTALLLAVVLGLIVFGAMHLLGRTRAQEWGRWAELAVVPVLGVILLGIASWVASPQVQAGFPSQFSLTLRYYLWDTIRQPFAIATNVYVVLVDLLVIGEVVRFGSLLIQRLRQVQAPPAPGAAAPSVPAWLSIVGPAAVVGLWIAADALLVEPSLLFYGVGLPQPPIPSLGWMLSDARPYATSQPPLALVPLTAVLVLYAALNLVGFGVRGVLRRAGTN
jgi:peptide/nickel transport system permease protein